MGGVREVFRFCGKNLRTNFGAKACRKSTPHPVREKIASSDVHRIHKLVQKRLRKLGNVVVSQVEDLGLRLFLLPGPFFISWLMAEDLASHRQGLGDSFRR